MNYLPFLIALLLSHSLFAQLPDTIPPPPGTTVLFFGSTCYNDTVIKTGGRHDQYTFTLIKPACILTTTKKGRVVWTVDVKKDFEDSDITYLCLYGGQGKRILVTDGQFKQPKSVALRTRTGRRIH